MRARAEPGLGGRVVEIEELRDEAGAEDEADTIPGGGVAHAQRRSLGDGGVPAPDGGEQAARVGAPVAAHPPVARDGGDRAPGREGDGGQAPVAERARQRGDPRHVRAVAAGEDDDVLRVVAAPVRHRARDGVQLLEGAALVDHRVRPGGVAQRAVQGAAVVRA